MHYQVFTVFCFVHVREKKSAKFPSIIYDKHGCFSGRQHFRVSWSCRLCCFFFFFFFFSYPLAAMWLFKHFVRICLQHMWCLEICIAFHIIRLKSVSLHFLPSHSCLSHFAICCTMFRLIFHSMSLFFFQYWFCLDSFVLLLFASCAPNDNEFRVCLFFCWSSKFIASMWLVRS